MATWETPELALTRFHRLDAEVTDLDAALVLTLISIMPLVAACCSSILVKSGCCKFATLTTCSFTASKLADVLHSCFCALIIINVPSIGPCTLHGAPIRASYLSSAEVLQICITDNWYSLEQELAVQLARVAILKLFGLDVCNIDTGSGGLSVRQQLQDVMNSLSDSLACLLRRTVFTRYQTLYKKAPDTLDEQGFQAVCHICGKESKTQLQFLHRVLLRVKGKLRILDLIPVDRILGHDGRTVYGEGVRGADAVEGRLQQAMTITGARVDAVRRGMPVHLVKGTTEGARSGSAGEFLMALVMGLAYDEIEELLVCIGAHAEGGDHTDLMVWLAHGGFVTFECKSTHKPAVIGGDILMRISFKEFSLCDQQQQNGMVVKLHNVPITADDELKQYPRASETLAVIFRGPFNLPGLAWKESKNTKSGKILVKAATVGTYLGP